MSTAQPSRGEIDDPEKQSSRNSDISTPDSPRSIEHQHEPHDLSQQETKQSHHSRSHHPATLQSSAISQQPVEYPKWLPHEIALITVLAAAQLMTQAGLGMSIAPLHIVGPSLGANSPGQLSWMPAAYSLTVGTFILPAGRLGDLYGHKKMVVIGYFWYALWSLIAGFAVYSGQILFDVCRAMQGIGPAILLPNAIAILGRMYEPGPRKAMAFSLFGATAPSGFIVGAVFSSLLSERLWWPWSYWIAAIFLLLLGTASLFTIPHMPTPKFERSISTWAKVDALGGLTGIAGLILINFAWNQSPIVGWQDPYTYILLIVGFVFMGLFAWVELRVAAFPLVPLEVMPADAGFIMACMAFGWATFSIWTYYFWQFLEELRHLSPLLVSAQFSPVCLSGLAAALTTGWLMGQVHGSAILAISLMAFLVGTLLLATAPVDQTYWGQTFVALLVMPWGMDMSFPAGNLLLSNAMPAEHQGVSASLVNTVVNYSISLALGIAGTIEVHVNHGGQTPSDLLKGYRSAWYLGIGLSGAGVVMALLYGLENSRNVRKARRRESAQDVES